MTKISDDGPHAHIGVQLLRAYQGWLDAFIEEMNAAGHGWFTQSRANVLGLVSRDGTRQIDLQQNSGMTKQALQQQLDGLQRLSVIERLPDPTDKRGRIVRLTEKGHAALADADAIKLRLMDAYAQMIGAEDLQTLQALLKRLA